MDRAQAEHPAKSPSKSTAQSPVRRSPRGKGAVAGASPGTARSPRTTHAPQDGDEVAGTDAAGEGAGGGTGSVGPAQTISSDHIADASKQAQDKGKGKGKASKDVAAPFRNWTRASSSSICCSNAASSRVPPMCMGIVSAPAQHTPLR